MKEWLLRLETFLQTKRQKDRNRKIQKAKREFNLVMSGHFRTLGMFLHLEHFWGTFVRPRRVACVGALPQSNFISRQWLSTTVDCIRLDLAMHASRPQSPVWLKSAATPQRSAPPRKKAATARNIAKPPREIIITLADLFQGRSMENFLKRAMTK